MKGVKNEAFSGDYQILLSLALDDSMINHFRIIMRPRYRGKYFIFAIPFGVIVRSGKSDVLIKSSKKMPHE